MQKLEIEYLKQFGLNVAGDYLPLYLIASDDVDLDLDCDLDDLIGIIDPKALVLQRHIINPWDTGSELQIIKINEDFTKVGVIIKET